MSSNKQPSLELMLNWLCSDNVIQPNGKVLSWFNPNHIGYEYPEAAGLLLSLLIQENVENALQKKVILGIIDTISLGGGVGKKDREYVFDTAVVLHALLSYIKINGSLPEPAIPTYLFEFINHFLSQKQATNQKSVKSFRRWSTQYNCHLLKVSISLLLYNEIYSNIKCFELVEQLIDDLLPLHQDGYFQTNLESGCTYVHASCYAVEGLIYIHKENLLDARSMILSCAQWLAQIQKPNGGIPSWYNGSTAQFKSHSDATAQAIRIWIAVDSTTFRANIMLALNFLTRLQSPLGGIRYCLDSNDVNTWATVFTVQALRWTECGASTIII